MSVSIFPESSVRRFVDTVIPRASLATISNPVLQKLPQIVGFGWANCTPQHRNHKLRESFAGVGNAHLVEHIGHAKRFVEEHVKTYIDGKLPHAIRKLKYALDVLKIIRDMERIVATLHYIETLIRREIALALAWARENLLMINFALNQITPAGLRTAAERELAVMLQRAQTDIQRQIAENAQMVACLI
jgi:hypothetical protein